MDTQMNIQVGKGDLRESKISLREEFVSTNRERTSMGKSPYMKTVR